MRKDCVNWSTSGK